MPIEKVIVLEDDPIVRRNLEHQLRQRRCDVAGAGSIAEAYELLAKDSFDLIFVDVRLPDGEGTALLQDLQSRPQKPLVVIVTGFGSIESAVHCIRNGAFDYILKPISADQIEVTLKRAEEFSQLLKVNRYFSHLCDDSQDDLLGESSQIDSLRQLIRKVGRTQATVLIQGESGTGKELVARALYLNSPRASAPFIKINCAAVPEHLIESEFFGHEKGAFTGAISKREGRFELAHGGTLLLDEISEVSPQIQAKLLRVLQERELERVGGTRTLKVDVRVIATTNRNLALSVERHEFRQDLFFRLNVVPIQVPTLRERPGDILHLAEKFLDRFCRKHGIRVAGISDEAAATLRHHDWPGNVRELQNVIERGVILAADDEMLTPDHLGMSTAHSPPAATPLVALPDPDGDPNFAPLHPPQHSPASPVRSLSEMERAHILAALDHTAGNRSHAARLLGISVRTLRNKLHEYALAPEAGE